MKIGKSSPLSILYVEDNEHDIFMFRQTFKKSDLSVDVVDVSKGEKAMEILTADPNTFDIVVSDYKLPGMTGLDLIREIIVANIRLPSMLITGVGSENLAVDALKAGVDDYIIKDVEGGYLKLLPVVIPDVIFNFQNRIARIKAEEALKESEERYRSIVENARELIWRQDIDGKFVFFNKYTEKLTGQKSSDWQCKHYTPFVHPDDLTYVNKMNESALAGNIVEYETRIFNDKGEVVYLEIQMIPFLQKGEITGTISFGRDITERKQDEEKIKNLLLEKELLLKEVHHRIRNNMSTIIAFLSLQSETLNTTESKMALKEAENRVQSMLVLYDKLFLSTDYVNVSTKKYFENLIDEIIYNFPNCDIVKAEYNIEDAMLDAKIIFNLGIIINELITNTMKHAFVDKEMGKINASLSVDEGNAIMTIQDDGTELPESVSFENPATGFGFKLVSMLVKQLDGSIQIERGEGTKFTIKFNLET